VLAPRARSAEATDCASISIGQLNQVLARYGVPALDDEEWVPLAA
jgi:hypothetical protein